MKSRLSKSVLLPLAVGLVQILSGCMASTASDPDKSAGGSDEIDTRIAVDRSGKPVVAARIALVRADDSTGKPVAVSATGKNGSFPTFVVPDGLYSVVLRDAGDSLGKYVDSVEVRNQKLPAGRDTLLALGSVRGVVRVAAGHSPATVTVGLLGTDILANVKADGTFRIELVPGGLYTLGAFPSLDGYGPLYKRIQLRDGQDLTLPDTLVMPFTGLPSPGALRVLQDTGTGNVRVSWNRVDHPDLLGYVLERVEGGTVTSSRYLTDTTWTDSLGATWEAMPLLGPWPSREVAYRVRARSLSGGQDSKVVAVSFVAEPPAWTTRVDSVRVDLSFDSVSNTRRFVWSSLSHPQFRDWMVERFVNGSVDCQSILTEGNWSDSSCPTLGIHPVDSSMEFAEKRYLFERFDYTFEYRISARTRSGKQVVLWQALDSASEPTASVVWQDIGVSPALSQIWNAGDWLVASDQKGIPQFSKDGVLWEAAPASFKEEYLGGFAGAGDSLWMVKILADSVTFEVRSRVSVGQWRARTVVSPRKFDAVQAVFVREGKLLMVARDHGNLQDLTWFVGHDSLEGTNFAGFDGPTPGYWTYGISVVDGAFYEYAEGSGRLGGVAKNGVDISDKVRFESGNHGVGFLGGIDGLGLIGVRRSLDGEGGSNFVFDASGRSVILRLSVPVESRLLWIFQNQFWIYGTDGHLWKGKVNLPE